MRGRSKIVDASQRRRKLRDWWRRKIQKAILFRSGEGRECGKTGGECRTERRHTGGEAGVLRQGRKAGSGNRSGD